MTVICDYCKNPALRVTGREHYPHRPDLYDKIIYSCKPCNASVGCHPGTDKPLGRLADPKLKRAKMAAHRAFDPLWKGGSMRRGEAYRWLAEKLSLSSEECHIGMFDETMCRRVILVVKEANP